LISPYFSQYKIKQWSGTTQRGRNARDISGLHGNATRLGCTQNASSQPLYDYSSTDAIFMDCLSAYFISLTAHGVLLMLALWDTPENVLSTLPFDGWSQREYRDVEASLIVSLSLGVAFCVIEVLLLATQVPPPGRSLSALSLHFFGSLCIFKFVIDSHPVGHFWIALVLFSLPPLIIQVSLFLSSFRLSRFC
uniref:Transmembrane protein 107 n=1 Tax=Ascaris lumbricoides TaxID=6252 RepID=A0A0M3IDH3_ASCLU